MIDDPSRAASPPGQSPPERPGRRGDDRSSAIPGVETWPPPESEAGNGHDLAEAGWVVETTISPFHCLYQDALFFHTQSRLAQSEGDASRLARAALILYVSAAEALVRQAASELGRPELRGLLGDPSRPLPLAEAWRLLPAIVAEPGVPTRPFEPEAPPWPQFAELLMLQTSWVYPGPPSARRAYYRAVRRESEYEPMEPHNVPAALRPYVRTETLTYPRTGLPRDPYALRPRHLDTARGVLDAAIEALDRRMGGTLCHAHRHRREPLRVVYPVPDAKRS